jgi:hypothetical protein
MDTYCIIGAGAFGLMCALNLRKNYKNAKIIIFDINKNLSSSVNGGNGMLKYNQKYEVKDISKSISINFARIPYNFEFYLFHLINQITSNKNNREIIKKIAVEEEKEECEESKFLPYNYWDKITENLIKSNVEIIDNTEIINYVYKNNKIILYSKNNKEYVCDKLILCTAGNLNLIKNNYYHKFIEVFSGYSAIIEVKSPIKCFYYKHNMFFTPYNNNLVKITFKVDIGFENNNYFVDKTNKDYNKIVDYITNNKEIQNLGLISIKNIWHGSRAMTYDIMPFISQIDTNVYLLTGGGYMGTHMANKFGMWLVELISNKPFSDLPIHNNKFFNPTIERLEMLRSKYYFWILMVVLFIMYFIMYFKKYSRRH